MNAESRQRAGELARVFLKLGAISVGGPAAHIALMRHEFVERRKWLSEQAFLDLIGATNLIPGPNSTEMAIHIGQLRAGWIGLLIAGACFILPAALIVFVIAAIYVRIGGLPETRAVFYSINPVVIAIVAAALWQLGRAAIRDKWHAGLAATALIAASLGCDEIALLALCAAIGAGAAHVRSGRNIAAMALITPLPALSIDALAPGSGWIGAFFLVFLKAGALLFGSGYVLLAFLRADLVDRLGWLTEHQLLDAIAVGQITPGPVFTTATFVGYVIHGPSGAMLATVAIFLPAFFYVAISSRLIPRLRRSTVAAGMLDGVNLASLALMTIVVWQLGRSSLVDATTGAIAVVSLSLLLTKRIGPAWLVAAAAMFGVMRALR